MKEKDDANGLLIAADEEEAKLRAEHEVASWASCGVFNLSVKEVREVDGFQVILKPTKKI